jgi:MoaA/NifB/PqqE/SkfB family radical SAM enzyme
MFCKAPYNSLYFSFNGYVYSCCINRTVLGRLSESSIGDIFNGLAIKKLREQMQKDAPPIECTPCITDAKLGLKNSSSINCINYEGFSIKSTRPSNVTFEISDQCNLNCIMCYTKNFKNVFIDDSLYGEEFIGSVKELIPFLENCLFIGGEPFVIPQYYKIWDLFQELNSDCCVVIQTNGTIFNERIANYFKTLKLYMSVSIDSFRKDTYELIRRNANYEETMKNFKAMHELSIKYSRFFRVTTCVMQQNWHELPEIVDYLNGINVPISICKVESPVECSIKSLSKEKIRDIYTYLDEADYKCSSEIEKYNQAIISDFLKTLYSWIEAA